MNLNHTIIVGHVSQAPELRMTPGGQSVASMSVATNRAWTDKNGKKQENVQFHSVVLWGRNAEVASEFLQKGSAVLIEGRLETRQWTDKENVTRSKTEIICENLQLGQRQAKVESAVSDSILPPRKAVPQEKPRADVRDGEEVKTEEIPF